MRLLWSGEGVCRKGGDGEDGQPISTWTSHSWYMQLQVAGACLEGPSELLATTDKTVNQTAGPEA